MTLIDEIKNATPDPIIQKAMLMASFMEGGNGPLGPWTCGDSGWSCGPFQINRSPGPPVSSINRGDPSLTKEQTSDPAFSVQYMLPRYQRCRNRVSGSGPEDLAGIIACAEALDAPANWRKYYSEDNAVAAYNKVSNNDLSSGGVTPNSKPQCTSFLGIDTLPDGSCIWPSPAGAGPSSPLDDPLGKVQALFERDTWLRIGLFLIGLILIAGGVHAITGISAMIAA